MERLDASGGQSVTRGIGNVSTPFRGPKTPAILELQSRSNPSNATMASLEVDQPYNSCSWKVRRSHLSQSMMSSWAIFCCNAKADFPRRSLNLITAPNGFRRGFWGRLSKTAEKELGDGGRSGSELCNGPAQAVGIHGHIVCCT